MKLIITRHGETIGNVKKIAEGHLPGKLSKNGISQTKKVALRLKDEKIDYIYSSDLKRAADTAKAIAVYHKKVPIKFVEELREVNLGGITGKRHEEIDWKKSKKEIETFASRKKRATKILKEAYKNHPKETVLFVGHSFINKALISVILNLSKKESELCKQSNTGITIFDIKENKNHKLVLMNCIKHLE